MFEGEKTPLFWASLVIATLAALILFGTFYYGVALLGFYMMKSGTRINSLVLRGFSESSIFKNASSPNIEEIEAIKGSM